MMVLVPDATSDVLDLIDAAVADWETGPDAVRYNVPARQKPEGPRLFFGGTEISVTRVEWVFAPLFPLGRMQAFVESFNRAMAGFQGLVGSVSLTQLQMEQFRRTFTRPPCRRGWDCLCHPEPFPAARDYRRRTKHRNRRRR